MTATSSQMLKRGIKRHQAPIHQSRPQEWKEFVQSGFSDTLHTNTIRSMIARAMARFREQKPMT